MTSMESIDGSEIEAEVCTNPKRLADIEGEPIAENIDYDSDGSAEVVQRHLRISTPFDDPLLENVDIASEGISVTKDTEDQSQIWQDDNTIEISVPEGNDVERQASNEGTNSQETVQTQKNEKLSKKDKKDKKPTDRGTKAKLKPSSSTKSIDKTGKPTEVKKLALGKVVSKIDTGQKSPGKSKKKDAKAKPTKTNAELKKDASVTNDNECLDSSELKKSKIDLTLDDDFTNEKTAESAKAQSQDNASNQYQAEDEKRCEDKEQKKKSVKLAECEEGEYEDEEEKEQVEFIKKVSVVALFHLSRAFKSLRKVDSKVMELD